MEFGTSVGSLKEPGLPNIKGSIDYTTPPHVGNQSCFEGYTNQGTGAFSGCQNTENIRGIADYNDTLDQMGLFDFDASLSNPIYGNSTTVQPKSLVLSAIIKY